MLEATPSRIPPPRGSSLNALVAATLRTSDTIAGWCSLYRRPETSKSGLKDEVRTILALRSGLDGYPGVCHGGMVTTLFDEVMSILVSVCGMEQGLVRDNVTADLRVTFVKPVPTPAVLLLCAKISDVQKSRKYYATAEITDCTGTVLARATGLFIHVLAGKL